jgi:hypothetical protein
MNKPERIREAQRYLKSDELTEGQKERVQALLYRIIIENSREAVKDLNLIKFSK